MIRPERATIERLRRGQQSTAQTTPLFPEPELDRDPEDDEDDLLASRRVHCGETIHFEGGGGAMCTLFAGHDEKWHECVGRGRWVGDEWEDAVDIIRTWPASVPPKTVAEIFGKRSRLANYYFTLGKGRPSKPIARLWFTYRGRILGSFFVNAIVQQDGSLPRLRRLDGEESEWQIPSGRWVAICKQGCVRNRERLAHPGFRGYRYFSVDRFRETGAAW